MDLPDSYKYSDYELEEKSYVISMLLALLPPLLPFGIHRHYLGKHGTGVLYFLSWLTGIGGIIWLIIDIVNMRKMVDSTNEKIAERNEFLHWKVQGSGYNIISNKKYQEPIEEQIFALAKKYNNKITVTQLAMETDLEIQDADRLMKNLTDKGYIERYSNDNGVIFYTFKEI